uniref:Uncharacterized protein n=1 Tax=Falco tinnunculus TaxID=100819 RepID=A0A8C4UBP8_FALTI
MAALRKNLTIAGYDRCCKTCLLFPTLFDAYVTDTEVDGKEMELILFDGRYTWTGTGTYNMNLLPASW